VLLLMLVGYSVFHWLLNFHENLGRTRMRLELLLLGVESFVKSLGWIFQAYHKCPAYKQDPFRSVGQS